MEIIDLSRTIKLQNYDLKSSLNLLIQINFLTKINNLYYISVYVNINLYQMEKVYYPKPTFLVTIIISN